MIIFVGYFIQIRRDIFILRSIIQCRSIRRGKKFKNTKIRFPIKSGALKVNIQKKVPTCNISISLEPIIRFG